MKVSSKGKNRTIAVKGAYSGAGATHMCLCLANYMASREKHKVIYIELGENGTLTNMVGKEIVDLDGVLGYKYMGVIYVPAATIETCQRLLQTRLEYIVVDVKNDIAESASVLNLCCKVIILGSFKPWNEERFGNFIQKNVINKLDRTKVLFFGIETTKNEKITFQRVFNTELHTMPIILNPLCIKQKEFLLIKKIILE